MQPLDWTLQFEIMCYTSVRVILRQRRDNKPYVIYYTNHMLDEVQINYKTTKKELLTTTFLLYKFKSYLVGSKVIVYTDHIVIKYLLKKKDAKSWLLW